MKFPRIQRTHVEPIDRIGESVAPKAEIDVLLRRRDVLKILSVSRSTLGRMIARGDFPPPLRISPNTVGFKRSAVTAYLDKLDTVKPAKRYK
jgi:predicted DNA-binding transcriptional regulator AlpA